MAGKCNALIPPLLIVLTGTVMIMVEAGTSWASNSPDYADALSKCILFFEGQRSGKLPSTQRMTWRKDSALRDGSDIGMDLVGGYYDAGDNVKFHFPMAFTVTMLAWSVIDFGKYMGWEKKHALEAVRWGSDYLLKATSVRHVVVGQVADSNGDHNCWERPEDMDTPRTSYVVNETNPGTEVSAEIAAALAASSIAFKASNAKYSAFLLQRSKQVFGFADGYQGSYNLSIGEAACPFYCDYSGYADELLWAAAWLYKATQEAYYWGYLEQNIHHLESIVVRNIHGNPYVGASFAEFGWDAKHAGINVLVSQLVMKDDSNDNPYILNADKFVCSILPESPSKSVTYTPGGLLVKPGGSNTQHATASSFLLIVYSLHMSGAHKLVRCGDVVVTPSRLINIARSQVDYLLGNNPLGMSYMVGFGPKFPRKIHHRGATLPSIHKHPQKLGCRDGDRYLYSQNPDMNQLTGAIIGGPAGDDSFSDSRMDVGQTEPTTYINAPFVGVLAYFKATARKNVGS
ncbi:endoglucanase 8-like [Juglans microcarpa x Juglans regia]|uniref:endoglucanase 8-like n=1 Tax=Juglans microcarpa x Juglans regia TaxID=2249226 RepID=UPI001B7ED704|nr:endoglucanase 8-like [Juglans microcarpa x Juglans regia]